MPGGINLSDMLFQLFGVQTTANVNPITTTVGVTAERILAANPRRVSFVITNLSANSLYISPLPSASSSSGIYIAPNGGSITLQWDKDFEMVGLEWYAIAGGAASSVFTIENVITPRGI